MSLLHAPFRFIRWLWQQHLIGSLLIVVFATAVISSQVAHRTDFAATELAQDVESRWGAPVAQAAPSVRWVRSGSIFTELKPLALSQQHVEVDARMNYRKRGLKYFSGFDFTFVAQYVVTNPEAHDIDVAFVFPVEVDKAQVLLSELQFHVNGEAEPIALGDNNDRLLWTGRLPKAGQSTLSIRYRARGLDSFIYHLDPTLPAQGVKLHVTVEGGDNYDYPAQVLAASQVTQVKNRLDFDWTYPSLESGVSLGVILPSLKEYDALAATMAHRGWASALAFFAALVLLGLKHGRPLSVPEMYLAAAAYGFFFVLVAYLGAFMHFYLAYALASAGLGTAVTAYLQRLYPRERWQLLAGVWLSTLVVPTLAVVLTGFTGLIYTLELLAALLAAMLLITRTATRELLARAAAQ